jgi:hypothetical protein
VHQKSAVVAVVASHVERPLPELPHGVAHLVHAVSRRVVENERPDGGLLVLSLLGGRIHKQGCLVQEVGADERRRQQDLAGQRGRRGQHGVEGRELEGGLGRERAREGTDRVDDGEKHDHDENQGMPRTVHAAGWTNLSYSIAG